jgi:uncharacterized membrane protein YoaK (UPF0700 family)
VTDQGIIVLGIPIPSSSRLFLAIVAVHVAAGLICAIAGVVAMLSTKRAGRHPAAGTIYFWSLLIVFVTMCSLSILRWPADNQLLVLGVLSFAAGAVGRTARRHLWRGWARIHMTGMALSYILLLTAFYVDNGPHLPVWRHLSPLVYWLLPSLVGLPILIHALLRHPLVHHGGSAAPPSKLFERRRGS